MKWTKRLSVVIFAAAAVLFVFCLYHTVRNGDSQGPVIVMEDQVIQVSIQSGEQELLAGIRAEDLKDGDVTDSLMVEYLSNFIGDGERKAGVAAFDSAGNIGKAVRTIRYTDYRSPEFSLSAPLRFAAGTNADKLVQSMRADDCLDGDISRWIQQYNGDGSVFNSAVPGIYPIIFSISNSAGDVEKFQAQVEIYDPAEEVSAPQLYLTEYLIYLGKGDHFDPMEYLSRIIVDGIKYQKTADGVLTCVLDLEEQKEYPDTEIRTYDQGNIQVRNPVDTNECGWYEVSYTLADSADIERTVRMIVCVREEN